MGIAYIVILILMRRVSLAFGCIRVARARGRSLVPKGRSPFLRKGRRSSGPALVRKARSWSCSVVSECCCPRVIYKTWIPS